MPGRVARRVAAGIGVIAGASLGLGAAPALAASFTVTSPADDAGTAACDTNAQTCPSLRDAINNAPPGSTILLGAATYTLLNGELSPPASDTLTIQGAGDSGANPTLIVEGGSGRVLDVPASVTLTLSNLQVEGAVTNAINGIGANILTAGTLTLTSVQVSGGVIESNSPNDPSEGGGIASTAGTLTITDSVIKNNEALGAGGTFTGQTVTAGGGEAQGGGIYIHAGGFSITNTVISGNTASGGGGVNTLANSSSGGAGNGGGIAIDGGTGQSSITGGSIIANVAEGGQGGGCPACSTGGAGGSGGSGQGGGIYFQSGSSQLAVRNVQIGDTIPGDANQAIGGQGGENNTMGGLGGQGVGGGIYTYFGTIYGLLLSGQSSLTGNAATGGTGGGSTGASPAGNGGQAYGGGIGADGTLEMTGGSNSPISVDHNSTKGGSGGNAGGAGSGGTGGLARGAGVFTSGDYGLTYLSIAANTATGGTGGTSSTGTGGFGNAGDGGGLYSRASAGNLAQSVSQVTISGNQSDGGAAGGAGGSPGGAIGGGVDVNSDGNTVQGGTFGLSDSLIASNHAGVVSSTNTARGGGFADTGAVSPLELVNDTITGNTAGFAGAGIATGGGVYLGGSANNGTQPLLANSTVADNAAVGSSPSGGNLYASGTQLGLQQTIVSGGAATGGTGSNCATESGGTFKDDLYNLEDTTPTQCGLTSGFSIVGQDPQLSALGANGGPTMTMALAADSPAVDAAGAAGISCSDGTGVPISTDQRGVQRGEPCDIGAFELSQPPTSATAPQLTGTAQDGQTLDCSNGSWGGGDTANLAFTYAWLRDGQAITAQTANSYQVNSGDAGHQIACQVTASNDDGHQSAVSGAATIVTLTSPADGSTGNANTPNFSGSAGIQAGDGTSVEVRIYAGSVASGQAVQSLSAQVNAMTGGYSTAASPSLADGQYTAQASQTLGAGSGLTSVSDPTTFTVDTVPPAVTLTAPANGSVTTNTGPNFSGAAGTATGDQNAITVSVYSGTTATGTPVQTLHTNASAGAWSVGA